MQERLPPIGFWSYARQDDGASSGRLSSLRLLVMNELSQQYGHNPITIFQDVAAIPPGAEWEREIRNAIGNSTFFIPIITPAFVESKQCAKEVELFLEREAKIWQAYPEVADRRRVFPIYYRTIDDVQPLNAATLEELRKLQWTDYRELRYKDPNEEVVQRTLELLGASMSRLLHIQVEPPVKVEPPLVQTPPVGRSPTSGIGPPRAPPDRTANVTTSGGDPPTIPPPLKSGDTGTGSAGTGAGAEGGQPPHAARSFAITGGASTGSVVWSIVRQLLAVGLVIWAIVIGLHIPSQISSGGPQSAVGLFAFIVAMLGGAGVLWRGGR